MLRRWTSLIPLLALAPVAFASPAASATIDGRQIVRQGSAGGAPACSSCHGANLEGTPALRAPALAGRPASFIVERLDHYAGPSGHNPTMRQVATALSQSERAAVAGYIATLRSQAGR